MKKAVLLAVITILCLSTFAQQKENIVGKWKIVTIDAVFFHDFRNDSTYYPPEFLESLKGNKDSSFMIGFFDGMIKGFQNYYYEFGENKEYKEVKKR